MDPRKINYLMAQPMTRFLILIIGDVPYLFSSFQILLTF